MTKGFKNFLSLFSYADEDRYKRESIAYICDTMDKAEETATVLTFDKLADEKYSPNPILDRTGKLLFNTKTLMDAYKEYLNKIKYVNTEVALIVRENYLIMRDMTTSPLKEEKEDA